MEIGLDLSIVSPRFATDPLITSVRSLFDGGVKGAWYDPSDLSTGNMYQDYAKTTPVTAVEQPVSWIQDKSGNGNHAYTPSDAATSRPVLSARVNLLTKTEEFNDAVWSKSGATVTQNYATAPDGTTTADRVATVSTLNSEKFIGQAITLSSTTYKYSIYVKDNSSTQRTVGVIATDAAFSNYAILRYDFDTALGSTEGVGAFSSVTYTKTDVGNGWLLLAVTFAYSGSASIKFGVQAEYGLAQAGDYLVWGADARVSNDGAGLPAYQRVNTSSDYATSGFPLYLKFDGSNDYMVTASVDLSAGDEICVAVGLRKTSDAALGVVLEHSASLASNNGTFLLSAPNSAAANFNFSSKGSSAVANTVTTYTSPVSAVIVADADISAATNKIRINGGSATTVSTSQGSGNYGDYPIYLGSRGGTSNPFSGRLYGAVVRAGVVSTEQATNLAAYLNSKTKAY